MGEVMKPQQRQMLYAGLTVMLVIIWIFYSANGPQTIAVLAGTVRAATLLALGAMCGMIGERSGVVNIGIEGQFLLSAFAAFTIASMTGSLFMGTVAGIGRGLMSGWLLAALPERLEPYWTNGLAGTLAVDEQPALPGRRNRWVGSHAKTPAVGAGTLEAKL